MTSLPALPGQDHLCARSPYVGGIGLIARACVGQRKSRTQL
jgi:hypothetical protein